MVDHSNVAPRKDTIKTFIMANKTILKETRRKNHGLKYSGWRLVLMARFCIAKIKLDFFYHTIP